MNKYLTAIIIVLLVVVGVLAYSASTPQDTAQQMTDNPVLTPPDTSGSGATTTPTQPDYSNDVEVNIPAAISSPLTLKGKVRGTWYFEAVFPLELRDAEGTVIARGPAQAEGDWMTTDLVPFTATLTFTKPATKTGTLVIMNDNPSGLPKNQKIYSIPVTFK